MKKDDFRKIYDEIDYTDEFKAEMRKKLSEPAQIRMTSDEYENIVEGVDTMKRNKIMHTLSAIAACGVIVTAAGAVGFAMKGASKNNSEPMSSADDDITISSQTEVLSTIVTGEKSTIPSQTEALSTIIIDENSTEQTTKDVSDSGNNSTYFNKLGLPDIDPENDTDEEIIEAVRKYVAAADDYSFETMLPSSYPETYAEEWYDDINITVYDAVKRGDMIIDSENMWYYAFKEDSLTLEGIKEDVLSVYSEDYRLLDEIWSSFKEENGKIYCKFTGGDFAGFLDFSDSKIEIKSKDENKIVADVYVDFTDWVTTGYHDYYVPDEMQYLFPEDYRYEYPLQITLVCENSGWRVSEYTNRTDIVTESLEACPEYQAVREYINKGQNDNKLTDYSAYVCAWNNETDAPGYELNIESINDGIVTFNLSKYRMYSTGSITADTHGTGDPTARIAEFDTFGDENEPGIRGYIYFRDADSVYVVVHESTYPYSEPIEAVLYRK
ncbi:MAG: hypothetical protein J6B01_02255 [Ruminococcus sp.]|nr:hypothetical protein [Ruminococcus sp.]